MTTVGIIALGPCLGLLVGVAYHRWNTRGERVRG